ncbi:hypothetical protein Tco_0285872, partial [Tanacetum coccineum]
VQLEALSFIDVLLSDLGYIYWIDVIVHGHDPVTLSLQVDRWQNLNACVPGANAPALQPTSSYSIASSGVRYVTSKILGNSGNGSRMRGFVRGNGNGPKANGGTTAFTTLTF